MEKNTNSCGTTAGWFGEPAMHPPFKETRKLEATRIKENWTPTEPSGQAARSKTSEGKRGKQKHGPNLSEP